MGVFSLGKREALHQQTNNRSLRYQLIQCLYRQGKSAAAEDELRRLKQLEANLRRQQEVATDKMLQRPHDPVLHQELGQALLATGQTEQGLYWLHRALREDPSNKSARRVLIDYYRRRGDLQRLDSPRRLLPETAGNAGKTATPSGPAQPAVPP